jgi:hypothetical protein
MTDTAIVIYQSTPLSAGAHRRTSSTSSRTAVPVITGHTGADPIFKGAADFDLELIESRTLDGRTRELIYRPTLHN